MNILKFSQFSRILNEDKNSLPVPSKGLVSPSNWNTPEKLIELIQTTWNNYKSYFQFASKNSGIPVRILLGFTIVESGGDPKAGGSGHITQGLMQWNRKYAKSQLEDEFKKKRLSQAEKEKLATFNIKFDANGKTREITNADQLKPELNILIGSIILGQLAEEPWATFSGLIRWDRVIAVYNSGAFGDTGKKARTGNHSTPKALADDVNTITKAYIAKMLGKDGVLDLIQKNFKQIV